ncbi:MAG: hypothetical protein CL666_04770 [Balneola sp.]|nr:hypothetical protein [Balneola sp.]|tara:strand:- start:12904 stop:13227 length:324 start_codon:yes stop_codon:yes gene_type:complete
MNDKQQVNRIFEEQNSIIVIYCKGWCKYLQKLVNILQQKQQSYTFFDLRFNTQKADGLLSKLGNPLILPILEFNGTLHERPSLSEVERVHAWADLNKLNDRTNYRIK